MDIVDGCEVRAAIATHVLGAATDARLGDVTLHAHQRDAVGRVRRMLDEHGGALLADDVGLGKTYAALAVARGEGCTVVIAPAAVRAHWSACAARAGVAITFHSMESLSRRGAPTIDPDLVIIDEAHHFRGTHARRFSAARQLCASARVLLLSATPVQNRDDDVRAMLSLFLGSRAAALLTPAALGTFVIRRVATDLGDSATRLPHVGLPEWLPPVDDIDCLDRILALPAPLAPAGGGDGGALVTFGLLRQWSSSRAALTTALRRRLASGLAMIDALRADRMPTRAELASWCHAEDVQQLCFPELVQTTVAQTSTGLLSQVERHVHGLRDLLDWLGRTPNPDPCRAQALLALIERHQGARIIAFSEYAATVAALFRLVLPSARAALLTHGGGWLASGRISRDEILARFSAGASLRAHHRDRIDLLLTTDVLSEGVSLPDASVVVHLDLSWNPARLEQRVGRVRRVDSMHPSIAVYLMPPPAPAERMLRLERRLRVKRALAHRALGVAGAILPGDVIPVVPIALRASERLASVLQSWRRDPGARSGPLGGAVRAAESGAIACVRVDGAIALLAVTDSRVSEDRGVVERLCASAGDESVAVDACLITETRHRVERFLSARQVSNVVDLAALRVARTRRALLRRANAIARGVSREMRPRITPLLHAVRAAAAAPLSAGAERALHELAEADLPDDAWLHAINAFAAAHAKPPPAASAEILALLLLRACGATRRGSA
jgi:superfamily II DNA or RNA helicase